MIPSQAHRTKLGHKSAGHSGLIKIETLYYADKEKIDSYILSLIVCLHYFISLLRPGKNCSFARSPAKSPISFPSLKISAKSSQTTPSSLLTVEEREMLRGLKFHVVSPVISKSQELQIVRPRMSKYQRLSKSISEFLKAICLM